MRATHTNGSGIESMRAKHTNGSGIKNMRATRTVYSELLSGFRLWLVSQNLSSTRAQQRPGETA